MLINSFRGKFTFFYFAISIFVVLFRANTIQAQNFTTKKNTSEKAKIFYAQAVNAYNKGDYKNAIQQFKKAELEDNNFIEAKILVGSCYLELKDTTNAMVYLNKAFTLDCCFESRVPYILGKIYYNQKDFKKAERFLKAFIENKKSAAELVFEAQKLARDAHFIDSASKKPVVANFVRLSDSINFAGESYRAIFNLEETQLYYSNQTNRREHIYVAEKDSLTGWRKSQQFSAIATEDNEGAHTLSANGKFFLYTACNRELYDGGPRSCDIYYTQLTKNGWSPPKPFSNVINTEYWESQPSLSSDGKTLFFASNRPGGFGMIDIWYSELKNGAWTKPRNCGSNINTPYDDEMPFIHPDGETFYFSSKGFAGMGAHDIFVSKRLTDSTFSSPINLGNSINTAASDIGLTVSNDGKKAFYSREDNVNSLLGALYSFELPEFARAQSVTYMKCRVKDAKTLLPLRASAEILDFQSGKTISTLKTNDVGEFIVALRRDKQFAINISAKGYLFFSENLNLLDDKTLATPYVKDIFLMPITDSLTAISNSTQPIKKTEAIILKNVFFETNQSNLTAASHYELDNLVKLLNDNPNLKIELRGHTDNTGNAAENQKLSERRAKAVYDYLIAAGIAQIRLRFSGKGDTEPIESNATESGKAKNRRTDFKVF